MGSKKLLTIDGIGVALSDRIVRVDNDAQLKSLLEAGRGRSALQLSARIKEKYESESGKALDITTRSLAAEIYYHYLLQEITLRLEKIFGQRKPTRWMIRHMKVIDCGEKAVDNNRFLWDLASIFWKKS